MTLSADLTKNEQESLLSTIELLLEVIEVLLTNQIQLRGGDELLQYLIGITHSAEAKLQ